MKKQSTILIVGEAKSLCERDFKHLFVGSDVSQLLTIDFKELDSRSITQIRRFARRRRIRTFGLSISRLLCKRSFSGIEAMLNLADRVVVFHELTPVPQSLLIVICMAKNRNIPIEIIHVPRKQFRTLFA